MRKVQIGLIFLLLFILRASIAVAAVPGTVYCWGFSTWDSASPSSLRPVAVAGMVVTNAIAVAAGDGHGLALRSDGTVVGWGINNCGQAIGSVSTNSDRASGLVKIDGQILSNVVAVAAGGNHSLALKADGTVVSWGSHVVPTGLSNIIAISSGYNYSMGVRNDGMLLYLGGGDLSAWKADPARRETEYAAIFSGRGNSRLVDGLTNVVNVSVVYGEHAGSLALMKDGIVAQISVQHEVSSSNILGNAIAVSGGRDGLALTQDGRVVGWGPASNVPDGLKDVVAIAGGPRHNLALKRDGTVAMWGFFDLNELAVPPNLRNVVGVAVGMSFFLVITTGTP